MTSLKKQYDAADAFWRRWAAVFILILFFLFSWGGQFVFQMQEVRQQSQQHGQQFQMSEFWPEFFSATFENWQSEWLQLATQAIMIAAFADAFFRKGNQDHYKTHIMIEELREDINKLKKA